MTTKSSLNAKKLVIVAIVFAVFATIPTSQLAAASRRSSDNDNSDSNNDNNQASERDWSSICDKISFALISSCSDLVNSDNTLTSEGVHVRNCIENGALLAGGAILLGTPPTTVLSLLPFAAKLGGCDNVINFNAVTLGQLRNLGSLIR